MPRSISLETYQSLEHSEASTKKYSQIHFYLLTGVLNLLRMLSFLPLQDRKLLPIDNFPHRSIYSTPQFLLYGQKTCVHRERHTSIGELYPQSLLFLQGWTIRYRAV